MGEKRQHASSVWTSLLAWRDLFKNALLTRVYRLILLIPALRKKLQVNLWVPQQPGLHKKPCIKKKERSFVGSHPDLRGWGIVHNGYNGARLSTVPIAKINESGPWSHFPGWFADCAFQNCISQNTTWGFCFKSWKVPYMWASVSVKTIAFT